MWHCGKCGEQNEDQFEACWKCQAAAESVEDTALDILFDPDKPQPVSDGGVVACPTCGQQFRVQGATAPQEASGVRRRSDSALCPHCGHTVTPELLVKVAAAKRDASASPVREVIYACPYCGKVLTIGTQ